MLTKVDFVEMLWVVSKCAIIESLHNFKSWSKKVYVWKEVIGIELDSKDSARIMSPLSTKKINSKPLVVLPSVVFVSKYNPANSIWFCHMLVSGLSKPTDVLLLLYFCFNHVKFKDRSIGRLIAVPNNIFVRGIDRVPCLPCQVGLIGLFPVEDII